MERYFRACVSCVVLVVGRGGGEERPPPPLGPASQRAHLDDVDLRGVPGVRLGALVRGVEVVAGDDEHDGGGAEGDPLLGPGVPPPAGHHDGSDGPLHGRQGPLVDAVLQPGDAPAQQLQEAAPDLTGNRK